MQDPRAIKLDGVLQDASPESVIPLTQPLPSRTSDEQASADLPLAEWMDKMGRSNGSGPWLDDATMQVVQKLNSAKVRLLLCVCLNLLVCIRLPIMASASNALLRYQLCDLHTGQTGHEQKLNQGNSAPAIRQQHVCNCMLCTYACTWHHPSSHAWPWQCAQTVACQICWHLAAGATPSSRPVLQSPRPTLSP